MHMVFGCTTVVVYSNPRGLSSYIVSAIYQVCIEGVLTLAPSTGERDVASASQDTIRPIS